MCTFWLVDIYLQNLGEKNNTFSATSLPSNVPSENLGLPCLQVLLGFGDAFPLLAMQSPHAVPGCPDQLLEIAAGFFSASKKRMVDELLIPPSATSVRVNLGLNLWICNIKFNHYMLLHFLHYKVVCLHVFSKHWKPSHQKFDLFIQSDKSPKYNMNP